MSEVGYEQRSGRTRFFELLEQELELLIDPDTGRIRGELAEPVSCPVCGGGGTRASPLFVKDGLAFERCGECGLVYMNPRPSDEALARLYAFESKANDAWVDVLLTDAEEEFQTRDFSALLDQIQGVRPEGRLLDVGCSIGRFLALARERGYDGIGLELGERASEHARAHYGLDVRQSTLQEAGFGPATFDVVTLIEVLEHVPDPRGLLREIHRVLKPGGALLVGVPNVASLGAMVLKSKARMFNRNHLTYFDEATLSSAMRKEGFEPVRSTTAVSLLDSIVNELQGGDPFGALDMRFLPERVRSELADPGGRAALETAIVDLGLGYRLRMLSERR